MRTNGTLQIAITSGGGVNEYGEPVAAQCSWSDTLDCSIKTNSDNRIGKYEDGEFRIASFTVLAALDSASTLLSSERIKLVRGTELLGEYRVMNVEVLSSVGRVLITV